MTTTIIPNPARPGHTCAAQMRGRPCSCGQWAAYHQYHWHLTRIRPLPTPVPCPGARGLWRLPSDVHRQVLAQLDLA